MERVIPGSEIWVTTFSDLKAEVLPFNDGIVVIEVLTQGNDTGGYTAPERIIEALEHVRTMDGPKPRWTVLCFGGWDWDKRPLIAIPEVCAWCREFVTKTESRTLGVLAWEKEANRAGHGMTCEIGFGLHKLITTAGYGRPIYPHGKDSIDATPAGDSKSYKGQVLFEISPEGAAILDAALAAREAGHER